MGFRVWFGFGFRVLGLTTAGKMIQGRCQSEWSPCHAQVFEKRMSSVCNVKTQMAIWRVDVPHLVPGRVSIRCTATVRLGGKNSWSKGLKSPRCVEPCSCSPCSLGLLPLRKVVAGDSVPKHHARKRLTILAIGPGLPLWQKSARFLPCPSRHATARTELTRTRG